MTRDFDPKKLPFHWRKLSKFQKYWCSKGKHVPVMMTTIDGTGTSDVFCQECAAPLTVDDHERFFRKARL